MSDTIHISVRTLVEHVYRSGSIDSRFRSQSTLLDGTRIHQMIQKTYQEPDRKEVYLRAEFQAENLTLIIDGRCDGLLFRDEEVVIDEIKSYVQSSEQIQQGGYPVHWAQAKLYGYMYAKDNDLQDISIQLTYVHVDTLEKTYFKKRYYFTELAEFLGKVIEDYSPYANLLQNHRRKRNKSCKELTFPFESYRDGQRKLAGVVYKSILDKKNLFAKAPTG
ncbi:MAG: ATP-dependent DNA helicase, partial [Bacillus sp. (in: firmicutes)]